MPCRTGLDRQPPPRPPAARCAYLIDLRAGRCVGPAVDPAGPILLCREHLARAVRMFQDHLRRELEAVPAPGEDAP